MSRNTWPEGTLQSAAWELGFSGVEFCLPRELAPMYLEGVVARNS